MNSAGNILQQPFVQVALPIIVALMLAAWLQNKRFDDINRRIDEFRGDVNQRLERIETKLDHIITTNVLPGLRNARRSFADSVS